MAITEETFKNKLEKFLPPFVVQGEIRDALLTAVARRLFELHQAIDGLHDSDWTGKGLEITAKENGIFYNDTRINIAIPSGDILLLGDGTQLTIRIEEDDATIQQRLINRLDYWKQRGTREGVKNDLEAIYGLDFSTIYFRNYTETGIITGITSFNDDNFVGQNNIVEFWPSDQEYIARTVEKDRIIKKYVIPLNAEIIYKGE